MSGGRESKVLVSTAARIGLKDEGHRQVLSLHRDTWFWANADGFRGIGLSRSSPGLRTAAAGLALFARRRARGMFPRR